VSGRTESIYFASPIWLQQVMVATFGWHWYRRRFGRHFHRLSPEFKAREHWSAAQFRAYQEERLAEILRIARDAPYYRRVFAEVGLTTSTPPFEALARLPMLAKEVLRTRARDLLTRPTPPRGTSVFRSSGTTGTPTEIYFTPEFHGLQTVVGEVRSLNWAGLTYRDRRVMFGVRKVCHFGQEQPPFWRFSPAENMAYASIYHLSPRFLSSYMEFLRTYRPAVVMGYPSSLATIARYAEDSGDRPAPARAVVTTAEAVTPAARRAIEAVWQCRVWDRYGAVEACVFASQCERGRYHVSPEVGIVEILDATGRPVPPGVPGEVVCTGLQNTLQPLIRYRIGDVARWSSDQECSCGRQMPVLEAIEGRFEDLCYTADGREMLRFDTVFKGVRGIREAQVVQEALDRFRVYVIPADSFGSDDVARIQENMRLHVGVVRTDVRAVETIPRTASGKFRAVVCKLSAVERRRLQEAMAGAAASRRTGGEDQGQ
jgi:phenylacetate-CoA ligase